MTNTIVSNTIAATAGDISLIARMLNITVTGGTGTFPTLSFPRIQSIKAQPSLIETAQDYRFSYTAADNTAYSLTVIQTVNGQVYSFTAKYTSGTGTTATIIGNALAAQFPAGANGLQVTATHSSTNAYIDIVGNAGYPLFTGLAGTNTTVAANMATGIISSNTTATPTVFTASAAHNLVIGMTINIATADATKFVAGTYRVRTIPSATTFTLSDQITNLGLAGTSTTTGTWTVVAQVSSGIGTTLAANGVTGATAGTSYSLYTFNYNFSVSEEAGNVETVGANAIFLYIAEQLTVALLPTTNFTNFDVYMRGTVIDATVAGQAYSPPAAIAIGVA